MRDNVQFVKSANDGRRKDRWWWSGVKRRLDETKRIELKEKKTIGEKLAEFYPALKREMVYVDICGCCVKVWADKTGNTRSYM